MKDTPEHAHAVRADPEVKSMSALAGERDHVLLQEIVAGICIFQVMLPSPFLEPDL